MLHIFKIKINVMSYLPCSYGEKVPASILIYGSIFIDVTRTPDAFSIVPILLAITPFPIPLITPPVTSIYFIAEVNVRLNAARMTDLKGNNTIIVM